VLGFNTPTRKFELFSERIAGLGKKAGRDISALPIYQPLEELDALGPDQLIMVSFKWNVHNAHRTMQSKWLREIVHSNPAWLNPATAERLGLRHGDWIELTSFNPRHPEVPRGDGSMVGKVKTRVHLTHGVHPSVVAFSHNAGRWVGGPVAANPGQGPSEGFEGFGSQPDPDVQKHLWWTKSLSVSQNGIMPNHPDPITGQQAWHGTLVKIARVAGPRRTASGEMGI
jgi:thiosulfate reductase / polysulfide reductase chain A